MEIIREEGDFRIIKIDTFQYKFEHTLNGEVFEEILPRTGHMESINRWFENRIKIGGVSIKVKYYKVSYNNDIKLECIHDSINTNKIESFRNLNLYVFKYFLNKEEGKKAINEVLPKAMDKYSKINSKLNKLCEEDDFYLDNYYEGDTYGIIDDALNICFNMEGFSFNIGYSTKF